MYDGKEQGTDLMEVGTPPQPSYVVTAFPLPVCNLEMNYLKTGQLDRNYTHTFIFGAYVRKLGFLAIQSMESLV